MQAVIVPRPKIVLDTNATLDWLVFKAPSAQALGNAVASGQLSWLACDAMRQEFAHIVSHPRLARWQPDVVGSLQAFDMLAHLVPRPACAPGTRLTCRDPDDQVFIDLALAHHARWLVTHDRALLSLARRARPRGVAVLRPADWSFNDSA